MKNTNDEMMHIRLTHTDGIAMRAENAVGNVCHFDGSPAIGGTDSGFRPMEGVLASLASCSAIDFLLSLKKARIAHSDFQIDVSAVRADAIPAVFTDICLTFTVCGKDLLPREPAIQRLMTLAVDKYCSVAAMLKPHVDIRARLALTEAKT